MLGKGRAVELMDAIGAQVRKLIEPGAPAPDALRLERVADAIVSIEYYMETLQNGRNDPWYMLDNAEMCIKSACRGASVASAEYGTCRPGRRARPSSSIPAATLALERAKRAQAVDQSADCDCPRRSRWIRSSWSCSSRRPRKRSLRSNGSSRYGIRIPWIWNRWPPCGAASIRLKGSGRMVGARLIAEFGWSIENLLNRIIDKTLSRTPGMMALLRSAVAALPQLVEQLETGRQNPVPLDAIMARAFAYADGREAEQLARGTGAGGSRRLRRDCRGAGAAEPRPAAAATHCRPLAHPRRARRCPPAAGGHGSLAARDLQQGDLEPSGRNSRLPAQARRASPRRMICRSPCIAPSTP